MADIEKVIKALNICVNDVEYDCVGCPYFESSFQCNQMKSDAFELLKEYRQHLQNDLETLKEEKRRLEFEHEAKAFIYKEKEGR